MKTGHVFTLLMAAVLSIASANGVAEEQNRDRTGSPDGSNSCNQCHMGGGFSPTVDISLEDSEGTEILAYVPGETYTLSVEVSNFFPFPDAYGFQATALLSDLSNAGQFSNPGAAVQIEEVNHLNIQARHVIEHSQPSFLGNFSTDWTAPLDADTVHFYAAGVTANGNGEPEGDNAARSSLSIAVSMADGLSESVQDKIWLSHNSQAWQVHGRHEQPLARVDIYSIDGRLVRQLRQIAIGTEIQNTELKAGQYIILITPGRQQRPISLQALKR